MKASQPARQPSMPSVAERGSGNRAAARAGSAAQRQLADLRDNSARTRQLRELGQRINGVVPAQLAPRPVVQRVIREDIIGRGFTEPDTDSLKQVVGNSCGNAWTLVNEQGLTPRYFRRVMAEVVQPMDQRRVLDQLSDHYYSVARFFCTSDGQFLALLRKGLNSGAVDRMCGTPVPRARETILSLFDSPHIDNVGKLGRVFDRVPSFVAHVDANKDARGPEVKQAIDWLYARQASVLSMIQAAGMSFDRLMDLVLVANIDAAVPVFANYPALRALLTGIQNGQDAEFIRVIGWLAGRSTGVHAYLETAAPTVAALDCLAQEGLSDTPVQWLRHFAKDAPPGHDDYEAETHNSYRVGHFSRHHTLRGVRPGVGVPESKTLMPEAATVDTVRAISGEFDAHYGRAMPAGDAERWTPPAGGGARYQFATLATGRVEQCYPCTGATISPAVASSLSQVYAVKNNWPD